MTYNGVSTVDRNETSRDRGADGPPLDPAATEHRVRRLGPVRSLPGGRAVLGGVLVAAAALVTFTVAGGNSGEQGTGYLVAANDLDPGTVLDTDAVETATLVLDETVAAGSFRHSDDLLGATVLTPVTAGELIQRSTVLTTDESGHIETRPEHQLSFEIERSRAVDGRIEPGEGVDIIATYGTGADATTSVVVRDARVVAVNGDGGGTLGLADAVTITLGLDSDGAALRAAHALDAASVTLVRAVRDSASSPGPDRYEGPSQGDDDA